LFLRQAPSHTVGFQLCWAVEGLISIRRLLTLPILRASILPSATVIGRLYPEY